MERKSRLTPLDTIIGHNLRALRRKHRLSQQAMAEMLGITFQQLQKYERGSNRLPAARLYALHCLFDTPMDYFFMSPVDFAHGAGRQKKPPKRKECLISGQ